MPGQKVSVLGAGNAGYTISWHLAHGGNHVMLFEHPDFKQAVEPAIKSGGVIEALPEADGHKAFFSGSAKLEGATTDIKKAVEFADILMIMVPAFGAVPIFELALPHLRDGQIIFGMPGNLACIDFARIMKEKGVKKDVVFAECETIPYGCRRVTDNKIFINGMKRIMHLGVLPANRTDEVHAKVGSLVPALKIVKAENVLEVAMMNMNMIIHPPPSLFNAGWVETRGGDDFSFYRDAISPSVARYTKRVDEERMAMCKAAGIKTQSCIEIFCNWYDLPVTDYYRAFHESPYHGFFGGPASMDNRYVTEDIGYLLLPLAHYLAPCFKVKTPAIDAMVVVAETYLDREMKPARDLSVLLKPGEPASKLHERLQTGQF